jgi:hypothetical protein|tara:strand:+ start:1922 stop:2119 length:198 start_codon:yes stop_codon:yes gene_type:complete
MKFITFLIRWVAGNLSIPFWVVGHIHLSIHDFHDLYEVISSVGMNIIVAIGFYLEWKDVNKEEHE